MLRHRAGREQGQGVANLLQSSIGPSEQWLEVSRTGRSHTPWYLLTSATVVTSGDAWRVVMAYARRWQVETCHQACRTDLAVGIPGPRFRENRLKLLLMVSLVYALLLSLLARGLAPLVQDLLRHWLHKMRERYRQAAIPLPGLRAALTAPWLTHPLPFTTPP